jgi:hypothetical protein
MQRRTLSAAAAYLVASVVMTWPVVLHLGSALPGDLSDPVLNTWILGRNAQRLEAAVAHGPGALRGFWDAGIFHPEPLTLAYSEHLLAPTIEVLPLHAVTGNPVLCYNVLFLSTFFLSGLFCFLFVRDLTGSDLAAGMAGLFYALGPYRIYQIEHLQMLSSQWMPLSLLAFGRYFEGRRRAWLLLGVMALVLHNLSCGYLLFFFAPFVLLYVVHQVVARGLLRSVRVWLDLFLAGLAVTAATLPFLLPYRELRARGGIVRPLEEIAYYAADVSYYAVAPQALRVVGPLLRGYTRPEGALYPGIVVAAMALLATSLVVRRAWRETAPTANDGGWLPRLTAWGAGLSLAATAIALVCRIPGIWERVPGLAFSVGGPAFLAAGLALATPRLRRFLQRVAMAPPTFFAGSALLAFWLSLGPTIRIAGRLTDLPSAYMLFFSYVPGFDGLRVPARFAMVLAFFLAVLGGYGTELLARRGGRFAVAVLCAAFFLDVVAIPLPINGGEPEGPPTSDPELRRAPSTLAQGAAVAHAYDAVRTLPADSVLVELPFGARAYEVQYMFYALHHGHRLVNGWSGWEPPSYIARLVLSSRPWRLGRRGWEILRASGATHALVHEDAWRHDHGSKATEWLEQNGARRVFTDQSDVLLALPPP